MTEQAGHRVVAPVGVFDALTQNHVTAALAMHRTRRGEAAQAFDKTRCCRDRIDMQFGVATGQPAAIGVLRRRFIGQRRKSDDLRAGAAPGFHDMRVDKAECPILR